MSEVLSSSAADRLRARLDDPKVAASLNLLLDNIDGLALAALSVNGFVSRAETISESLADGLGDVKSLSGSVQYLAGPTKRLADEAPQIADAAEALLDSGMLSRDVVTLLGAFAAALLEGAETAKRNETSVHGIRATLGLLKDPEVGRGLGLLVEVARALGRSPVLR